ncbi:hypothetical protein T10_11618 [Trichinella papuae]|uniref:Uncharacterized protein n=1 Tax=Trichinella papuae TaxID=268474 RepID=A0A0V1MDN7_9BILA|nr:hypothetical protein T10_11618 [Trichinella papuae]
MNELRNDGEKLMQNTLTLCVLCISFDRIDLCEQLGSALLGSAQLCFAQLSSALLSLALYSVTLLRTANQPHGTVHHKRTNSYPNKFAKLGKMNITHLTHNN